ncbi:hypothetical protein [Gordonia rhizosphera]|uniref:hypothetical protein n=1 Tax=Gordonia rhizosphera TaxID=83341 RepID=UPI0012F64CF5|nr:hypothetical protein [Gordonia rhizosphera]
MAESRREPLLAEPTLRRRNTAACDTSVRPWHPGRPDRRDIPILDRLRRMAVSASRVVDERSIPGEVVIDLDAGCWRSTSAAGYLRLFVADHCHDGTIAVVLTRFVVDHPIAVSGLIDHAFTETRSLPDWREQEATRTQPGFRTEGSSMQTGTYLGDDQIWFCALRYAAYRRGNVAYLLHATGTAPAAEPASFRASIAAAVSSVRFED